jgi:hypothetical protein
LLEPNVRELESNGSEIGVSLVILKNAGGKLKTKIENKN